MFVKECQIYISNRNDDGGGVSKVHHEGRGCWYLLLYENIILLKAKL